MRPLRDPEKAELDHLINAIKIAGKDILEIGSGLGQLTFQYSNLAKKVIGIDPEFSELKNAMAGKQLSNLDFIAAKGEHLPFPRKAFDIVIFASSL